MELEVTLLLIVRFRVAVESHPCARPPAKKAVYTPEALYVVPFQVYELQATIVELEVTL